MMNALRRARARLSPASNPSGEISSAGASGVAGQSTSPLNRLVRAFKKKGEKPPPPRVANLRWPDGRLSGGQLIEADDQLLFRFNPAEIFERNGPLTESEHYQRRIAAIGSGFEQVARDLPVSLVPSGSAAAATSVSLSTVVPDLPVIDVTQHRTGDPTSVPAQVMDQFLHQMGSTRMDGGPAAELMLTVPEAFESAISFMNLVADGISEVLDRCPRRIKDYTAMCQARSALLEVRYGVQIDVMPGLGSSSTEISGATGVHAGARGTEPVVTSALASRDEIEPGVFGPMVLRASDGHVLGRGVEKLREGEHLLLPVDMLAIDDAAHFGMLFCTRLAEGMVRLTVINPNGWLGFDGKPIGAVHRHMTEQQAVQGLPGLVAHEENWKPRPEDATRTAAAWIHCAELGPLLSHFESIDAPGARIDYLENELTPPQKGVDCVAKTLMMFLRQALDPSDYKLLTASLLMSSAQDIRGKGTAFEPIVRRMEARATKKLAGYVLLP